MQDCFNRSNNEIEKISLKYKNSNLNNNENIIQIKEKLSENLKKHF